MDRNGEETWDDLIWEAELEKNLAGIKAAYQARGEWKENEVRELGAVDRLSGRLEKLEKGMNLLLAANSLTVPERVKKAQSL